LGIIVKKTIFEKLNTVKAGRDSSSAVRIMSKKYNFEAVLAVIFLIDVLLGYK
jgi:hypothetical protein